MFCRLSLSVSYGTDMKSNTTVCYYQNTDWFPKSNTVYVFIVVKPEINSFPAERQYERFLWLIFSLRPQISLFLTEISHSYTWKKLVKVCRLFKMTSDQKNPTGLCGFYSTHFLLTCIWYSHYQRGTLYVYSICVCCLWMVYINVVAKLSTKSYMYRNASLWSYWLSHSAGGRKHKIST